MNKQIYLLLLLIFLAPSCGKKRINVAPATPVCEPVLNDGSCPAQPIVVPNDSNVEAFTLDEDENPFQAAVNANDSEHELVAEAQDSQASDINADSANYGLKTIYYDFNNYDIRDSQNSALKNNLKIVKQLIDKGYDISIEGHACNFAGDSQYNIMLSEKRASGIADYMTSHGANRQRIHVIGHGWTRPIVPSGNKEQQAPNRRVEIYAYKQK